MARTAQARPRLRGNTPAAKGCVRRRFTRVVPVFWQQYRPLAHQTLLVFNGGESFSVVAEAQGDAWDVYDDQMWTTFQSFLPTDDHENPTSED